MSPGARDGALGLPSQAGPDPADLPLGAGEVRPGDRPAGKNWEFWGFLGSFGGNLGVLAVGEVGGVGEGKEGEVWGLLVLAGGGLKGKMKGN